MTPAAGTRARAIAGAGGLLVAGAAQVLPAYELPRIDIHGFISQGYIQSTENDYLDESSTDGSFEYREVGINFGTDVTERLRIGVQLFARDLGVWSNNEVVVDWAIADLLVDDRFSLRAGKVKTSFGLYRDVQDFDFLRQWALLPTAVYHPGLRVFNSSLYGGQAYGYLDLGAGGGLGYELTVGDTPISDSQDLETLASFGPLDTLESANVDITLNAHLNWDTPVDGLRVVASYHQPFGLVSEFSGTIYAGPSTILVESETDFDFFIEITAGAEYQVGDWTFAAEYIRRMQEADITSQSAGSTMEMKLDSDADMAYVSAARRLNDHWSVGAFVAARWEDIHDRDGDKAEEDGGEDHSMYRYDVAISARYDFNEYWLVKAEAHFVNGTAGLNTYNDDDEDLEEDWQYFLLKTTFNF